MTKNQIHHLFPEHGVESAISLIKSSINQH